VLTLCGGTPIGPQLGSLAHGAHIIIGTPGRIDDHLRKKSLKLNELTTFVLDEADRMLDMGFQPQLDAIIQKIPRKRQTLLFSATYPDEIRKMAARVMDAPVFVEVESRHDVGSISQCVCQVASNADRIDVIRLLLLQQRPDSVLVFCNTRKETVEIADALRQAGFVAGALHGELEQRERDETLVRFSNNSTTVLVATDVAARGLDIDDVQMVINYQLAREPEVHIHRIGRTARAGKKGMAVSLFTDRESRKVEQIESLVGHAIETLPPLPASLAQSTAYKPAMATLQIDGGRKQKLRPGDILGALTATGEIAGSDVGKINIFDQCGYVAIKRTRVDDATAILGERAMKGRSFRVRRIS
jgi:ATP-independent RNA helicase DbpA